MSQASARDLRSRLASAALLAALTVAACTQGAATPRASASGSGGATASAAPSSTVAGVTASATGSRACMSAGVLLPNSSEPRWAALDGPLLKAAIQAALPGANVDEQNAAGDAAAQLGQAQLALRAGDCVLVVAPVDPAAASQIVAAAAAVHVPVIAYDRLIESKDTSYFVGFNQKQVGQLIGQYVADHYASFTRAGKNVAVISGDQRASGILTIRQGEFMALQPLFDNASLKKVYDQFTPNGDSQIARTEMEGVLTANSNNIQVVVTSDDSLASGVIPALTAVHLNGKVLVTGAGASVAGLRGIVTGDQAMTVEENPKLEADAAGKLVAALSAGTGTSSIVTGTTATAAGDGQIPSVLETPVAIDRTNLASTAIADGLATLQQVCAGLAAGTGAVCP